MSMDARIKFTAIVLALSSLGADYSSKNFVVSAPDPQLAQQVAMAAEKYRRDLAIHWLGQELPPWGEKCPISVRIAPQAGGQTSFGFARDGDHARPIGWEMEVYGSPERILDSVLPHEVTHTIFATYFGRPLPRWADEGACTTVEHESERNKNHQLLLQFLTTNRGIPFNRMFSMKQYPHDIYPLYAQGYSLARFLIMQRGPRQFVEYVETGMNSEQPGMEPRAWDAATKQCYGYDDLSELQVRWVQWVKQGCPNLASEGTSIAKAAPQQPATASPAANSLAQSPQNRAPESLEHKPRAGERAGSSWYLAQAENSDVGNLSLPAADSSAGSNAGGPAGDYRPGSLRDSHPLEVLANPTQVSVSANRITPESMFYARPEIESVKKSGTCWR